MARPFHILIHYQKHDLNTLPKLYPIHRRDIPYLNTWPGTLLGPGHDSAAIAYLKTWRVLHPPVWSAPASTTYNSIYRRNQKTPQTVEMRWYRQKTVTFEQFLQTSVHAAIKSTKRGVIWPKTCKNKPIVVKWVLDSKFKPFPFHRNWRKLFWTRFAEEKSLLSKWLNYIHKNKEVK